MKLSHFRRRVRVTRAVRHLLRYVRSTTAKSNSSHVTLWCFPTLAKITDKYYIYTMPTDQHQVTPNTEGRAKDRPTVDEKFVYLPCEKMGVFAGWMLFKRDLYTEDELNILLNSPVDKSQPD